MNELKSVHQFERRAMEVMSETARLYYSADATDPLTTGSNEKAFSRYRIRPRVLRDVSGATLHCRLLGQDTCPVGVSPTALHCLANPRAEAATAQGCSKAGCLFVLSCLSSVPLAEVAGGGGGWLQVYLQRDRSDTLRLVREAEEVGFRALVVTVDSPNPGIWRRNLPDAFFNDCQRRFPNVSSKPRSFLDDSLTFADLRWLVESTHLPVVVKGILNGADAKSAVECGVKGILVSNHGTRLIEKVVATIDVLEEVTSAVASSGVEVYVDGGVRSGSDVFVALALGAKAVFVGRPALWGLAVGGEEGVKRILEILQKETLLTMQLAGVSKISDIERSMVVKL